MSDDDFNMIVNMLNGLLDIDNDNRREAEKQLEIMKEKNITGLLFLLSTILSGIICFINLRFKTKKEY